MAKAVLPFISRKLQGALASSLKTGTLFVFTRDYAFTSVSFGHSMVLGFDKCLDKAAILEMFADVVFPDADYGFFFTKHAKAGDWSHVYFLPCKFPRFKDSNNGRLRGLLEDFVGLDCATVVAQYAGDPRSAPAVLLCPFKTALNAFLKANDCDGRFLEDLIFSHGHEVGCSCVLRSKLLHDSELLARCLSRFEASGDPLVEFIHGLFERESLTKTLMRSPDMANNLESNPEGFLALCSDSSQIPRDLLLRFHDPMRFCMMQIGVYMIGATFFRVESTAIQESFRKFLTEGPFHCACKMGPLTSVSSSSPSKGPSSSSSSFAPRSSSASPPVFVSSSLTWRIVWIVLAVCALSVALLF